MVTTQQQQWTVCTSTLDTLVHEHLVFLQQCRQDPDTANGNTKEATLQSIQHAIEQGKIDHAQQLVQSIDAALLDDHPTLLFQLKLQSWIEILRPGTQSMLPKALEWLRNELAPLALGAHPETYQQFQAALPLLLCGARGDDAHQQAMDDEHWSIQRRQRLASSVVLMLRNRHDELGTRLERYGCGGCILINHYEDTTQSVAYSRWFMLIRTSQTTCTLPSQHPPLPAPACPQLPCRNRHNRPPLRRSPRISRPHHPHHHARPLAAPPGPPPGAPRGGPLLGP